VPNANSVAARKYSREGELAGGIGISAADGTLIDGYAYGAQGPGVSQGRFPDGSTKCWGDNTSGQLGNGTNTSSARPVQFRFLLSKVSTVSAVAVTLLASNAAATMSSENAVTPIEEPIPGLSKLVVP